MALEKEMETFEKNKDELLRHEGKFVLIHGSNVVDFFCSWEDAIKAGYQKFGLETFMVRRVLRYELPAWIGMLTASAA